MAINEVRRAQALDIYRDTPLRYLGYLGLFRINCSKIIPLHILRMACLTYIAADLFDKTKEVCDVKNEVMSNAGEVTLFHLGSSILVPSFVMSSISNSLAGMGLPNLGGLLPLPIFVAMAPIIGKVIDSGVDGILNKTYRKAMGISPVFKPKEKPQQKKPLHAERGYEPIELYLPKKSSAPLWKLPLPQPLSKPQPQPQPLSKPQPQPKPQPMSQPQPQPRTQPQSQTQPPLPEECPPRGFYSTVCCFWRKRKCPPPNSE